MTFLSRASRRLSAPLLCALLMASPAAAVLLRVDPDPAWRQADTLPDLAEVLELWLDRHSDWPRRQTPPAIRIVSAQQLAHMSGHSQRGSGRTRGLYDPETATIHLAAPWDPGKAEDAAILLHELVHHRQAPHHWYCPGAQERAAYDLQDAWLNLRGLSADVNWIAVTLEAGCTPRDIHPD